MNADAIPLAVFGAIGISGYICINAYADRLKRKYQADCWVTARKDDRFWLAKIIAVQDDLFNVAWSSYNEHSRPSAKEFLRARSDGELEPPIRMEWMTSAQLRELDAKIVWQPGALVTPEGGAGGFG